MGVESAVLYLAVLGRGCSVSMLKEEGRKTKRDCGVDEERTREQGQSCAHGIDRESTGTAGQPARERQRRSSRL